ncbi:hypothetical protein RND81_10G013900 [Saponaria officinalis]|uniref:Uncharacterized protein n=1 Tax=Saponaria officinalis TaxID=3572 RepID=A0AAW1HX77_SAPOF
MGTTAPLAIGTRGTIGSLVRREIEYFQKLDLHRPEHDSKKYQAFVSKSTDASASRSRTAVPTLGSFLSLSWRRKRKSGNTSNSGRFLPSMCSAVDIVCSSESKRFHGIPGYSYKSLKSDIDTGLNSD